jgi:hypothetical protein
MIRYISLFLFSVALMAQQGKDVMHSWSSIAGSISAEAIFLDADSSRTIYLFRTDHPKQRTKLCEFVRDADLVFSPDNSWIALNDFMGSSESVVRLFKRIKGLEYTETKDRPDLVAWDFLKQAQGVPYPDKLSHSYARVVLWSADSSALLIGLTGHDDPEHFVEEWFCVVDLSSSKATLDLRRLNRHSVVCRTPRPSKPNQSLNPDPAARGGSGQFRR